MDSMRDPRPTTLILARGEVLTVRARRGGLRVTCRTGTLWATTDRTPTDTLLRPDESASYWDKGTVVIEALRTAVLRLEHSEQVPVQVKTAIRSELVFG